jgi:hypothetical protein
MYQVANVLNAGLTLKKVGQLLSLPLRTISVGMLLYFVTAVGTSMIRLKGALTGSSESPKTSGVRVGENPVRKKDIGQSFLFVQNICFSRLSGPDSNTLATWYILLQRSERHEYSVLSEKLSSIEGWQWHWVFILVCFISQVVELDGNPVDSNSAYRLGRSLGHW